MLGDMVMAIRRSHKGYILTLHFGNAFIPSNRFQCPSSSPLCSCFIHQAWHKAKKVLDRPTGKSSLLLEKTPPPGRDMVAQVFPLCSALAGSIQEKPGASEHGAGPTGATPGAPGASTPSDLFSPLVVWLCLQRKMSASRQGGAVSADHPPSAPSSPLGIIMGSLAGIIELSPQKL